MVAQRMVTNLPPYPGLTIERLNGGRPILAPTAHWWESGVTFNSAAVYLPRSAQNDPLIAGLLSPDALHDPALADGVVAAHYRARPAHDPGRPLTRSSTGLAVFTPDTGRLLLRRDEPVLAPSEGVDELGIEDPRITRLGDDFYMAYCGVSPRAAGKWKASVCLARSRDLLAWEKLGAVDGPLNNYNNKDGVLFPEPLDGHYLLLHRPMHGPMGHWTMHLAISDHPTGPWHDCGPLLPAATHPASRTSWTGAGAVPIPLGGQRYLVLYHTGNMLRDGRREYDLDACLVDLDLFDPYCPSRIVTARVDRMMVPETDCEINGPFPDSVANVLFACGAYVYRDDLYLLYGGGDTYVMSARLPLDMLLNALEREHAGVLAVV
jgi:predicted GH43/DUF377 family glycosyl hydrolase